MNKKDLKTKVNQLNAEVTHELNGVSRQVRDEILERLENRQLCGFMGWKEVNVGETEHGFITPFSDKPYHIGYMRFKESWDWLMPVVKKIADIKSWSLNATLEWLSESQDMDGLYTKEDVYEAALQFILK